MQRRALSCADELAISTHSLLLSVITLSCAFGCVGCYFPEASLTDAERAQIKASLFSHRDAVKPQVPIGAVIEDQARLIGYDINTKRARPGDVVVVTYYIEGLADEPIDSEMFVQLFFNDLCLGSHMSRPFRYLRHIRNMFQRLGLATFSKAKTFKLRKYL